MAAVNMSRVIDKVYIAFFILVLPIAVGIDVQDLYPQHLVPGFLKDIKTTYLERSHDPLMSGTLGNDAQMAWFRSFLFTEILYQVPSFFFTLYGLFNKRPSVYILTLVYGVLASVTTLSCVATVIAVPRPGVGVTQATITEDQRNFLLMNYLPFMIFPLFMAVDSARQLNKLVGMAELASKATSLKAQ